MSSIPTIVGYGLREALRRKVFAVVLVLTAAFLTLYWLANHYIFRDISGISPPGGIEPRPFAGAFVFGLAMFATLFLGVVLAVFLTLGAVRGDAERGLLQPLIVRPVGRSTLLLARWLGAIAVFLLVFLSTFPVVIPFLLMRDAQRALRVSNAVAVVMLFITGYAYGHMTHRGPGLVGGAMVILGVTLVGLTMALGG